VLAANVIKGCQVTIGSDQATAAAIEQMGSKHISKGVTVSFLAVSGGASTSSDRLVIGCGWICN